MEELDSFNELALSEGYHFSFQWGRQFIEESVLLFLRSGIFVIAFYVLFDLEFEFHRQIDLLGKVLECVHLLGELCVLVIHVGDDTGQITNGEGIETYSEYHPDETQHLLNDSLSWYITIPHSCDSLESPIHRSQVLVWGRFIDDPPLSNPTVIRKAIKLSWKEPETTHEMHHQEDSDSNLEHTHDSCIHLQRVKVSFECSVESEESEHFEYSQDSQQPV